MSFAEIMNSSNVIVVVVSSGAHVTQIPDMLQYNVPFNVVSLQVLLIYRSINRDTELE